MSSMYAKYLKERTYDEILETDQGFATYRYIQDKNAVYIVDIYVLPEHRKSSIASKLADEICREALDKGCDLLIGTVCPTAKGSTDSIKVLIAYGMEVKSSSQDFIVFEKRLTKP